MARFSPTVLPYEPDLGELAIGSRIAEIARRYRAYQRQQEIDRERQAREQRQDELADLELYARGFRRGRAPDGQELSSPVSADPFSSPRLDPVSAPEEVGAPTATVRITPEGPRFESRDFVTMPDEDPLAGLLEMQRPRTTAPPPAAETPAALRTPGAYVPGLGFAGGTPATRQRYVQVTPNYYLDLEATPEARAAREAEERRSRLLAGLRGLGHVSEAQAEALSLGVPADVVFPREETDVNWQIVTDEHGDLFQVHPRTGETRPLGIRGRVPGSDASAGASFQQLVRLGSAYSADPVVKNAADIAQSYRRMQAAAKNPSAAGDLSLIFAYMKMLDPGSVVREGEFANAQNAAGAPDWVRNLYNRVLTGERLNPTQRAQFLATARQIAEGQRALLAPIMERYTRIAQRYNIDPRDVVYDPFDVVLGEGETEANPRPTRDNAERVLGPAAAPDAGTLSDGQVSEEDVRAYIRRRRQGQ